MFKIVIGLVILPAIIGFFLSRLDLPALKLLGYTLLIGPPAIALTLLFDLI
jgi:hypothetical protein